MGKGSSAIKLDFSGLEFDSNKIKEQLFDLAFCEGVQIKNLQYYLVSREKMVAINSRHLEHHYETDILTFDYCTNGFIKGEVYICPDVVKDNADFLKVSFEEEFKRVVFHGLLHLVGYDDKTDMLKEQMRFKEDEYLKKYYED